MFKKNPGVQSIVIKDKSVAIKIQVVINIYINRVTGEETSHKRMVNSL